MTGNISDQEFADRALRRLPPATPSPGLEAALLAAYDGWSAERPHGLWPAWKTGLGRFCEIIWPGAPVWAPASALAAALLLGVGLGTALPEIVSAEPSGFSLEPPSSFNLLSSDLSQEDF